MNGIPGQVQRLPPPLREEINVQHTGVRDLAATDFWNDTSGRVGFTVLMGDLVRDRINNKSCV